LNETNNQSVTQKDEHVTSGNKKSNNKPNNPSDDSSDDVSENPDDESDLIISYDDLDLDLLEPDEAIEELFEKINPFTIPSVIIGIILLVIFNLGFINAYPVVKIIIGFAGGLSFVFGCSELIVLAVKGLGRKLGWTQYFMGIIAAIGADSSDVVVVTLLLFNARKLIGTGIEENILQANILTLTSFTYVLTTVLINTLVLGLTMIVVSRKKPFKLPQELTFTESNLVLAMAIFSFVLLAFGITHEAIGELRFDELFQGVIGSSLLIFYILFVLFLLRDAKKTKTTKIGPQTLIPEYFPEDNGYELELKDKERPPRVTFKRLFKALFKKDRDDEGKEQHVALRRFPFYILVLVMVIGIAGIIFGGNMISDSIIASVEAYNIPILVYCVVVGFVSSAPETTITIRAIFQPDEEDIKIGLVHQVSSIDQTFFLLFGFPFLFASIIGINIPVAFDTTLVFAGIFAISLALHLMIIDDNHFDRVEGSLMLLASITSLLSLAAIGGTLG
jgi:hypothetical protein